MEYKYIFILIVVALLVTGCSARYYRFVNDGSNPPNIGYYEFCMYRPLADGPVRMTYWVTEKWENITIDDWNYPLSECQ